MNAAEREEANDPGAFVNIAKRLGEQESIGEQIARLTAERDALRAQSAELRAACKAAEVLTDLQHTIDNCDRDEAHRLAAIEKRDAINCQLAAALANTEEAK